MPPLKRQPTTCTSYQVLGTSSSVHDWFLLFHCFLCVCVCLKVLLLVNLVVMFTAFSLSPNPRAVILAGLSCSFVSWSFEMRHTGNHILYRQGL